MDIDKKEADKKPTEAAPSTTPAKPEKTPRQLAFEEFREAIVTVEKGVTTKDPQLTARALRRLSALRRKARVDLFLDVVKDTLLPQNEVYASLHVLLGSIKDAEPAPMEVEAKVEEKKEAATPAPAASADKKDDKSEEKKEEPKPAAAKPEPKPVGPRANPLPEVEMFLQLFAAMLLADRGLKQELLDLTTGLFTKLSQTNRRTLDLIASRVYYYYALSYENLNRFAEIRNSLLSAHRTACLHHDEPSQVVLTNAILRNYLHYNLYSQADKFRLNTKLPDSRSTSEHARYLYYLGKINSIQLHYGEAFANLTQAIRKAPQKGAVGFRQQATKLLVIVQLLMGEIPERSIFRQAALKRSLKPYFLLTQAVRVGNLAMFTEVSNKHKEVFTRDKTVTLIDRLRHNVIKTGLRNINLSYSRISIKDICNKLKLGSEEDAEYIIAKAISDGVIAAVIDREGRFVFSKENVDIYSTQEPQLTFHKRIQFCMDIHNGAVKSLRFPENANKPKIPAVPSDEDAFED